VLQCRIASLVGEILIDGFAKIDQFQGINADFGGKALELGRNLNRKPMSKGGGRRWHRCAVGHLSLNLRLFGAK
jgi:hypothetical protein